MYYYPAKLCKKKLVLYKQTNNQTNITIEQTNKLLKMKDYRDLLLIHYVGYKIHSEKGKKESMEYTGFETLHGGITIK